MKNIDDLPLETQLILERFNRAYRRLNMINSRKPLLEELAEELNMSLTDTEYYCILASEYIAPTIDNKKDESSDEVFIWHDCNTDYDEEPIRILNPAQVFLQKLHRDNNSKLTKQEIKILKLFWGIIDGHSKTYKQMSLILDIKTKKIKQMLKIATRKLAAN